MKKVVFTYTPSTPGKLCFRRNVDGYFYDFSDDTYKTEGSVTTKFVTPTEYITAPGVYYVENDISWDDGIYQAIWYPDDTETGTPVAWGIELEGNEQVLPYVTINETAIAHEVWTGEDGTTSVQAIAAAANRSESTYQTITEMTEETPGTGVTRFTAEALAEAPAPDSGEILADIATMQSDVTDILADTAELQTDWTNGGRLDETLDAIATNAATAASYSDESAATPSDVYTQTMAALAAYDVSVSSSHGAGSGLLVGGTISAVTPAGARSPITVLELVDRVRTALRAAQSVTPYGNDLMAVLYNRALDEVWSLLVQLGAWVAFTPGTLISDGGGQDYELNSDFRAFVDGMFLPRNPITATTNYGHAKALDQVGLYDPRIVGGPTSTATPTCFAVFALDNSQYLRFNTIAPAGECYDYLYYPEVQHVTATNMGATYTPWMGLCDALLARTLEEYCLQGLEYSITKHQLWRARAEADLAMLLGLRHLHDRKVNPSIWKGIG